MNQINQNKYPALRTISTIFKISAVVTLIIGVSSLLLFLTIGLGGFDFMGLLIFLLLLISALFQFAIAELIKVVVDIEYNTRVKE